MQQAPNRPSVFLPDDRAARLTLTTVFIGAGRIISWDWWTQWTRERTRGEPKRVLHGGGTIP